MVCDVELDASEPQAGPEPGRGKNRKKGGSQHLWSLRVPGIAPALLSHLIFALRSGVHRDPGAATQDIHFTSDRHNEQRICRFQSGPPCSQTPVVQAMLDRLTGQAHIFETGKESYRFRRTLTKKKGGKGGGHGRATLKTGDAMGRPSWRSSFLGDPGTSFFCTGNDILEIAPAPPVGAKARRRPEGGAAKRPRKFVPARVLLPRTFASSSTVGTERRQYH